MKTKNKGSIGELKVMVDLSERGFGVAQPHGDNLPFDIIAISDTFNMYKIQVKFISKRNGTVTLKNQSNTETKTKRYSKQYNAKEVDYFAIYCPETDKVYYIPQERIGDSYSFLLRIDKTNNNQNKKINWATDYENIMLC